MWFKNLLIYRLTTPFTHTSEELEEALSSHVFAPCSNQQLTTNGWAPPISVDSNELTHAANQRTMICLQRQDKILPAAVINEFLAEKLAKIKHNENRTPSKKERTTIKEDIIFELLPRAFSRSSRVYAYIDPQAQLLVVNSSSHNRAEELITRLRESLGSLPLIPIKAKNTIQHSLTAWVSSGCAPQPFELGGECELRDKADESAIIRCKNQDLSASEIKSHLQASMFVSKLELNWAENIDFIVDDQLSIKRLRFGDLIMDKVGEAESVAEQFDADFSIMTGELANFIPALIEVFGGEGSSD